MTIGIYQLEFSDGRRYIGSSVNISRRANNHLRALKDKRHHNCRVQCAYDLLGEFSVSTLLVCRKVDLKVYEQLCIDHLVPELNLSYFADRIEMTDDVKMKLRVARTGTKMSAEARAKMSLAKRGKKQPAELIAKRVQSLIGQKRSAEARANISRAKKGKAPSEATMAALKKKLIGGKLSPERCAKISLRMKGNKYSLGKTHSPEARAKLSAAHKGKKYTLGRVRPLEERLRISESMKILRAEQRRQRVEHVI